MVINSMLSTSVELRESAEPAGTDHTGRIVSFTAVGSGAPGSPRPWVCYTGPNDPINALWVAPDGAAIASDVSPAADNTVEMRLVNDGVAFSRGTGYLSPDGDYCCVIVNSFSGLESSCVTFSEYILTVQSVSMQP